MFSRPSLYARMPDLPKMFHRLQPKLLLRKRCGLLRHRHLLPVHWHIAKCTYLQKIPTALRGFETNNESADNEHPPTGSNYSVIILRQSVTVFFYIMKMTNAGIRQ